MLNVSHSTQKQRETLLISLNGIALSVHGISLFIPKFLRNCNKNLFLHKKMEVENSSAAPAAPAPDDDLEEGELSSDSNDDNETDNKTGDDAASPPHVNIILINFLY
jgi:hypothetical protein